MTRPVALIILDGFGLAAPGPGNAVALAETSVFDRLWTIRPRTTLLASGEAVGLPAGQMGNSEVGHLNIGAGRVVRQSLTYLRAVIEDGTFFDSSVLLDTYRKAREGGTLHLLGLVSDGGVHSDLGHLLALLELAERQRVARVRLHAFTDGRDSPPDGGRRFLAAVESRLERLRAVGLDARVATVKVSGFLGAGDKVIAIPISELGLGSENDFITTSLGRTSLETAQEFDSSELVTAETPRSPRLEE